MECNICGVKIKYVGPAKTGTGNGICEGARGIIRISVEEEGGSVEEEKPPISGAEVEGASDLFLLAFLAPLKVTVGSSRFQKFFLMYAKLMVGLKLSKDLESD